MITMTELAADQLRTPLQRQDLSDHGLRVFVQAGGCAGLEYGMRYEVAGREEDTVVEVQGIRLFVDPFSAQFLDGACIDYEETLMGTGFKIDNPNAVASCACGTSFRTEGDKQIEQTCA
jgi:iron-sulfur cluster assembly protein